MEGRHCFRPSIGCRQEGLVMPIGEYPRSGGCSVTGGFVYRGREFPLLPSAYVFGDYCTGILWALTS